MHVARALLSSRARHAPNCWRGQVLHMWQIDETLFSAVACGKRHKSSRGSKPTQIGKPMRWESMKPLVIRPRVQSQGRARFSDSGKRGSHPNQQAPDVEQSSAKDNEGGSHREATSAALFAWRQCLLEPLDAGGLGLSHRAQELEQQRNRLRRRKSCATQLAADAEARAIGAELEALESQLKDLRQRLRSRKQGLRLAPPEAVPPAAVAVVENRLLLEGDDGKAAQSCGGVEE
eukprot:TRINITY_DN91934_c0_g1_i1.p2 TRINITY_DN91934_c0_g1~~TRINITY_DN91934_c0_g1_i1.p2  ORF type:complete len:240 (+),score=48.28 TRINITY_DN91934_c0_g1_i1:22-720(+)